MKFLKSKGFWKYLLSGIAMLGILAGGINLGIFSNIGGYLRDGGINFANNQPIFYRFGEDDKTPFAKLGLSKPLSFQPSSLTNIDNTLLEFSKRDFSRDALAAEDPDTLEALKAEIDSTIVTLRNLSTSEQPEMQRYQNHTSLLQLYEMDREIYFALRNKGDSDVSFFTSQIPLSNTAGKWVLNVEPHYPNSLENFDIELIKAEVQNILDFVNFTFAFDKTRQVNLHECPISSNDASYNKLTENIDICYGLYNEIYQTFEASLVPNDTVHKKVSNTIAMMIFNQIGRAFIHIYDIPYSGDIDTSADELAVVLANEAFSETPAQAEDMIYTYAAALFKQQANQNDTSIDNTVLSISQELGIQRFADILCLFYGADPSIQNPYVNPDLDAQESGFDQRLQIQSSSSCPEKYLTASNFWYNTLIPHQKNR